MSRKDAIVMAILLNMGLLALLFATAVVREEKSAVASIITPPLSISSPTKETPSPQPLVFSPPPTPITTSQKEPLASTKPTVNSIASPPPIEKKEIIAATSSVAPVNQQRIIEVVVKEGDALEKIARAHKTTVAAIKEASQLTNEKIRVGQKLQVPVQGKAIATTEKQEVAKTAEGEYYTVESGDNPWTIAKKCHVRYSDIVALNHLNEEKARNLQAGDRVRIR